MNNMWENIKEILKLKTNIKISEKDNGIIEFTKISAFGDTSVYIDTNRFINEFQTSTEYGSRDWVAILLTRAANEFFNKKELDVYMEIDDIKFNYL